MSSMDELTQESKRIWVLGLLEDCPVGKSLATCPAKGLRGLPIEERVGLVGKMEDIQIDEIIAHHVDCMKDCEKPQA